MKLTPLVWSGTLFTLTAAFCLYPVTVRQSIAQPTSQDSVLTAEQQVERSRKRQEYYTAWVFERDHNYRAKENNDSQRSSLTLDELPAEVRQEAGKIAKEYREGIHLTLREMIERDGVLPSKPATLHVPELRRYINDAYYKGTGPEHLGMGSWAIGIRLRLDGTTISRPVYAKNPPDAPHDVWAENTRFLSLPKGQGFLISGWDDGRVTFDPVDSLFYGGKPNKLGQVAGHAASGQAGIPPAIDNGLEAWRKKQSLSGSHTKPVQKEQLKPDKTN